MEEEVTGVSPETNEEIMANDRPVEESEGQKRATEETNPSAETEEKAPEQGDATEISARVKEMGREEIVARMEELLNGGDIMQIRDEMTLLRDRMKELKETLRKEAADKTETMEGDEDEAKEPEKAVDEVEEKYEALFKRYKELRKAHKEAEEAERLKNLSEKEGILEKLKELVERGEENMKKANDEFKELQERWKGIGEVPREKMNDLWQQYHFLMEQFFNKMKINRELRDLDMKRNLEQKVELCEKAEGLIVEESIDRAFRALQDLKLRWREIGPVPLEVNEEIWQRFCTAVQKIDERRKEVYEQRKEEMNNNLLAKQALIEKAEEVVGRKTETAKEWNEVSAELDGLLSTWKAIGPVPREANEEIWTKFKGLIDRHYELKKEYFGQIRDEHASNYNRKIDLCLKAEAIAKRDDWKKATGELLELQKEWKEIGPVSRKVSEKIWHRFRGACDEFFARKTEYFNNMHGSEQENLQKKEAIIAQLKSFEFGPDKEENLKVIKDFQRQWMETGYVPIAEKERLQKEFRAVIDAHFEKLKISAMEAEEERFRMKLRNAAGDMKRFVNTERNDLMTKIDKLKADISQLENNMGFFANSRQADLLKVEIEKKIEHGRQQIALLEAKLRILRQSEKEEQKGSEANGNKESEGTK